jgi:hypothetical protein
MGVPGLLVASATGTTGPAGVEQATYAVVPSGVIAIAIGRCPTRMGAPAVSVARATGVTLAPP